MAANVPKHWRKATWEEKAKENPLFAVMTTPEMEDASATDFTPEKLQAFFGKGEALFAVHVAPLIERSGVGPADALVVEYGCGAGRILKAVSRAGYKSAGIDISQTMLDHCRDLVPEVDHLYLLDKDGRCAAPTGTASVVYSYAVVQHISTLTNYITALDEMCRMLRPGGAIGIQVNCEDFIGGDFDAPARTENFEDHSLHFEPGAVEPRRHNQDHWSGVYIGHEKLRELLAERGVTIERWYYHNPNKLRAVWAVGTKAG